LILPADVFNYRGAFTYNDGTEELLELDAHGWADPERLDKTTQLALIPKDGVLPVVSVNIPDGGKPVFKSRVFGNILLSGGGQGTSFRCYAVGYKKGRLEYLVWVLPTGDIEVGPEPTLATDILRKLTNG
jgi:hypothetical protein